MTVTVGSGIRDETLYRVTLSYACFGVIGKGGIVIEAAPIARWMEGKSIEAARSWVKSKHGIFEVLHDNE